METTLISSIYLFQRGLKRYTVEFSNVDKAWKVYKGWSTNTIAGMTRYPWNGVKMLPGADDADTILSEYLGIDE